MPQKVIVGLPEHENAENDHESLQEEHKEDQWVEQRGLCGPWKEVDEAHQELSNLQNQVVRHAEPQKTVFLEGEA